LQKGFLSTEFGGRNEIDNMQFAFMKGKGTTDAIFMARQMQENFRVKGLFWFCGFGESL